MFLKLSLFVASLFLFSSLAQAQPIEDLIPGRYVFSQAQSVDVGSSVCGQEVVVTKSQRTASVLFLGPAFQFIPRNVAKTVHQSNTLAGCEESDQSSRQQQDGVTILTRQLGLDCPNKPEYNDKTVWKALIYRSGKIAIDMILKDGTQPEATAKCVWIKK